MRNGRWVTIALVVSVALNIFLGAVVVTGWWRHFDHRSPGSSFDRAAATLTPDERQAVTAIRQKYENDIRNAYRAAGDARRGVRDVLREDKIDEAAMKSAFQHLRQSRVDAQAVVHAMIGEMAMVIGPERRRAFLRGLRYRNLFDRRDGPPPPKPR